MPRTTVLKGARCVDPERGIDCLADVVVVDGRIAEGTDVPSDADVIDVSGLVVAPGFIDLHVHLREPGQTHKETIATGTRAAAAGGFSAVVAMPNTSPPIDSPALLEDVQGRAAESAAVRVLQTAAISVGRQGAALTDAAALRAAGAVALTDDGTCLQNAGLMMKALRQAAEAGIPVIEHCEDAGVAAGGLLHQGEAAERLKLPGQPSAGEVLIAARDLVLSRETHWPIHLQHISARATVELARFAREHDIPLTTEVTPHHLLLTDTACLKYGTNAKMNPPLRSEDDRKALVAGLCDGTITAIATDHAPHTADEKAKGWADAPFGIVGLEAAVPLCLTHLYHTGLMSLADLIAAFTSGPRNILGLPYGTLEPGAPADIVVLDLETEHDICVDRFQSMGRNCPYDGMACKGRSVALMVAGQWVHSRLGSIKAPL
jgi:dihydroorotase